MEVETVVREFEGKLDELDEVMDRFKGEKKPEANSEYVAAKMAKDHLVDVMRRLGLNKEANK